MSSDLLVVPQEMLEGFNDADLILPRWRIDRWSGLFVNDVIGLEEAKLNVVIIRVSKSRILWPDTFSVDGVPLCFSANGLTPENTRIAQNCRICQFSAWGKNGEKPKCTEQFNFLVKDEWGNIAILSLGRTRLKVAKSLYSLWRMTATTKIIDLSTEVEKGDKGQYFQVTYRVVGVNNEAMADYQLMRENATVKLTSSFEREETEVTIPNGKIVDQDTGEITESEEITF
jgi:hypothetical protein